MSEPTEKREGSSVIPAKAGRWRDPREAAEMCLLFLLLLFGPRLADILWWLFDPLRWDVTFGTILVPILGVVFLPWTTLLYVLLAPGGIYGFEVVWLVLALVLDLVSYAGGGAYGRRRGTATY